MTWPRSSACLGVAVICALVLPMDSLIAQPPLRAPSAFDEPPLPLPAEAPIDLPDFDGLSQIEGLVTPETEDIPWEDVIEELVANLFPEVIEGDDNWGEETTIMAGFRIRGGRLVPREHEVNHGLWQRYSFSLVRPQETLQIYIDEVSTPEPGVSDFHWRVQLRGRCTVDVVHWTLGIKGFNMSTESDVTIRARVQCRLTVKPMLDPDTLLPEVQVQLQLRRLDMRLTDVDTRRIGEIGGWVAQEVGNGQRAFIEAILRTQQDRIRRRIQEEIDEELE